MAVASPCSVFFCLSPWLTLVICLSFHPLFVSPSLFQCLSLSLFRFIFISNSLSSQLGLSPSQIHILLPARLPSFLCFFRHLKCLQSRQPFSFSTYPSFPFFALLHSKCKTFNSLSRSKKKTTPLPYPPRWDLISVFNVIPVSSTFGRILLICTIIITMSSD